MKTKVGLIFLLGFFWLGFPLSPSVRAASAAPDELSETWDEIGQALRDWVDRARDYLSFNIRVPREERPLISLMLRNRDKLGLSADQVRSLEQLRNDFQKASIRNDADVRVAEMDLDALLDEPKVDMAQVEAKVREIERLRADLRIARIRTIEKGKEQLTSEQRKKLQELLSESQLSRPQPGTVTENRNSSKATE